jgi:hypothetical protein
MEREPAVPVVVEAGGFVEGAAGVADEDVDAAVGFADEDAVGVGAVVGDGRVVSGGVVGGQVARRAEVIG